MTLKFAVATVALLAAPLAAQTTAAPAPAKPTPQRIADDFTTLFGSHPGYRMAHAKGIIVTGTFTPAPGAKELSKAAHLAATAPVAVTARFSDATGIPTIPDADPNAAPRGLALRFAIPGSTATTDIVANSHNGFAVGTGEDFAAFLEALIATKPTSPHPSPIEAFLKTHPHTAKFVSDPKPVPVSFGTESWYGNNALIFINAKGEKKAGRYRIVPVAGNAYLTDAEAKKIGPNYLFDALPRDLAKAPIKFKVLVQLANPGDQTVDGSMPWPNDRKLVELGVVTLTTVAPDNEALQRKLAFNPIYLTDGITLSDDPLIVLRSAVYAISVAHRK